MLDRIPTKPNRYAVYDDSHNFLRYEYHERADWPTQAGDALNKANLLSDAVATALGLTGNPQVKDALEKLKALVDGTTTLANTKAQAVSGSYVGTDTYGSANKNVLEFDSPPKVVFIARGDDKPESVVNMTLVRNDATTARFQSCPYYTGIASILALFSGNQVMWYNTSSAQEQNNISGYKYNYYAIL